MALLRKIITIGNSRAVVIPQGYFNYWKFKGLEINQVELEINDKLIISPIFEEIIKEDDKEGEK